MEIEFRWRPNVYRKPKPLVPAILPLYAIFMVEEATKRPVECSQVAKRHRCRWNPIRANSKQHRRAPKAKRPVFLKAKKYEESTRLSIHTNCRIIGYTSIRPVIKLRRSFKFSSHKGVSFVEESEGANNMPTGARHSHRETQETYFVQVNLLQY